MTSLKRKKQVTVVMKKSKILLQEKYDYLVFMITDPLQKLEKFIIGSILRVAKTQIIKCKVRNMVLHSGIQSQKKKL